MPPVRFLKRRKKKVLKFGNLRRLRIDVFLGQDKLNHVAGKGRVVFIVFGGIDHYGVVQIGDDGIVAETDTPEAGQFAGI